MGPLIECLRSLIAAAEQWRAGGSRAAFDDVRILLVDDGSPSPLEKLLPASLFGAIEVLRLEERSGQGAALNAALATHAAAAYAITDSDCVVADTWLTTIARLAAERDDVGGVAGPPWRHDSPTGRKSRWLTDQETALVRHCTERAVRHREVRLDCRNVWLRGEVVESIGPKTFFPEDAGAALSGMTSRILAAEKVTLGFEPAMEVRHQPLTSVRAQAVTYFSRGATSDLSDHYAAGHRSLWQAFTRTYFRRHFVEPIGAGVSPAYVLLAHGSYWCGLFRRRAGRPRRGSPGR
ncbi:MAG TPA: glycosyltransferase family A protein [Mycobacteriales bacterium]